MSIRWECNMLRRNIFELLKEKYNVPNEMNKIILSLPDVVWLRLYSGRSI